MAGALREILARFGFEFPDAAKLADNKGKIDAFAKNLTALSEKVLGGPLKGAMKDLIGDVKEAVSEFKGAAAQLGFTNQEMQRWQFAAKSSGVQTESLTSGFRLLQKTVAAAASGTKEAGQDMADGTLELVLSGDKAKKVFESLGVEIKDASGKIKPSSQLMLDVGAAIAAIPDPANRTAAAMQVFGRRGTELIPFFNKGAKGMGELIARFDELGGGVSDEAIAALGANTKASREFDLAMLSLKSTVVTIVAPIFTEQTKFWTDLVAWVNKATKGTEVFRSGLIILTGAMIIYKAEAISAGIKTALAWLPTILIFAALVLLLDDVITFMKGGKSVTEDFIKLIFGEQAGKSIAESMRGDLAKLSKEVDKMPTMGAKIEAVFSTIGASITRFFVDDMPDFINQVWSDLTGTVKGESSKWYNIFPETFNKITAWLTGWYLTLVSTVIDGISDGLKNGWIKVSDTFKELLRGLIKDFKDTFKSHSPSEVFFDLTTDLPKGSIKALAAATPKVRAQAQETFGSILPGSAAFAPTVRVQTVAPTGPSGVSKLAVDHRSQVNLTIKGDTRADVRDGAREGLGLAFEDERRAMLASLEPSLED